MPVAVWGRLPASRKALERFGNPVVTFEDAFLRSVLPGPSTPPLGLTIDDLGVHFDPTTPSRLETTLKSHPLDDPDLLRRAAEGRAFLRHYGLSKYNPVPRGFGPPPEAGYVLVIDQVAGDAAIAGAAKGVFAEMLAAAKAENPDKRILIRTHPAVTHRKGRSGHFSLSDTGGNVELLTEPFNPVDLLVGAAKVYCVSSQMGFEAIVHGHRPVVFGAPFYSGWGLSDDRNLLPAARDRRARMPDADQMFAAAMLEFPFWFDRTTGQACTFEEAACQLLAEARHRWDGLKPASMLGMHMWKRGTTGGFLNGAGHVPKFVNSAAEACSTAKDTNGQVVVWAGREPPSLASDCAKANIPLRRMEDGFLRSSGLGAELTPALSLVLDDLGIYYDPRSESRLETLIATSNDLPEFAARRAKELRQRILETGVTKYNLSAKAPPDLPTNREIILVPGQVEDDASIRAGTAETGTNLGLLEATRSANPQAFLIYKPHPDVQAGLREGALGDEALQFCDMVSAHDTAALLDACDTVATMTSLLGFEALLRGKRVICYGTPFYAGWGLTEDHGPECPRRQARVSLDRLVHAALVDYPRYMDPVSGLPSTPERIVERLANGETGKPVRLRVLAKLQGLFAGYAFIWRRGPRRS